MSASGSPLSPNQPSGVVAEWVNKAQADLETAEREFTYQGHRNFDAVSFHAQQAIEKLMKAVLVRRGVTPRKTHDLDVLATELKAAGVVLPFSKVELVKLSMAAVHARYPGTVITESEAADLLRIMKSIWPVLRVLV